MVVWRHLQNWTRNAIVASLSRNFSSDALLEGKTTSFSVVKVYRSDDDLKIRILKLVLSQRSATTVLQNWVDEGRRVSLPELRRISKVLLKRRRVEHALEVLNWMQDNDRTRLLATDHAMRLELLIKTHNLKEAEECFENLPDTVSKKVACLPLLHSYVKERATKKAETFILKMNRLGLIVSSHPYNEMMKLYMATSEQEKVLSVIQQMKQNQIPRNVLSYNLWMNACAELSGPASAEIVYKEMTNDKNVLVGWSSFCTLASIYRKSGLIDKAIWALRQAEKKLSTSNRLGYLFLMTIYASLNSKDEVLRLWKISKGVSGRIVCNNYMCILSCLVKLGDTEEAEKIFLEWECQCRTNDIRVPNILLGAYSRNGSMKKAESLLVRTLDKGGHPNFKTWEILMEGLVRNYKMNEGIDAMIRILG